MALLGSCAVLLAIMVLLLECLRIIMSELWQLVGLVFA